MFPDSTLKSNSSNLGDIMLLRSLFYISGLTISDTVGEIFLNTQIGSKRHLFGHKLS